MHERESQAGSRSFAVSPERAGTRLDRFLAEVTGYTRSRVQALVKRGAVRVDDETVRRNGLVLASGQAVFLDTSAASAPGESRDWEPEVLHVDDEIVVLSKPAGVLCHGQDEVGAGTLADHAERRWGPLPRVQGPERPGIVHRLDRGTSGLVVLARTPAAMAGLLDQFRARSVRKRYLAIVHGAPRFQSGWIEEPIGRSPRQPDRWSVVAAGEGREASTYWELRERFHGFALVECRPRTGRTHQLRVHLTHAGHSLVGDRVYRTRGIPVRLPPEAPAPERQALHAAGLAFRHPVTGAELDFEAPLPADLAALVAWLRTELPPQPLDAG